MRVRSRLKSFSPRSNEVGSEREARRAAMSPKEVLAPVATTSALAVPLTTEVPRKTMFSASGLVETSSPRACFSTGSDSPVNAAC